MTKSLMQISFFIQEYFDSKIDLESMQSGIAGEINNFENESIQNIRMVLLKFEAFIEDTRFTVSSDFQKQEIEKYYKDVLLPILKSEGCYYNVQ